MSGFSIQDLHRRLEAPEVRAFLSVAIVASLVPFPPSVAPHLDRVLLVVFSVELLVRLVVLAGVTSGRLRMSLLLVLDMLALASFLPVGVLTLDARFLRLFRLSRLLLAYAYWGSLVGDLRAVLSRPERRNQLLAFALLAFALAFTGAVLLQHLPITSIDTDGDGQLGAGDELFFQRLWWAFRQLQDPGNMISGTDHAAAAVVSLILTIGGLVLFGVLVGLAEGVLTDLYKNAILHRPPGVRDHDVVVHVTEASRLLVDELIEHHRTRALKQLRSREYVLVGRAEESPDFVRGSTKMRRVHYRQGHAGDAAFMDRTSVGDARRVVLLADRQADDPDTATIEAILRVSHSLAQRDPRRTYRLVAELLDYCRIEAAWAAAEDVKDRVRTSVVPTEELCALYAAAAGRHPGLEHIALELLTTDGHALYTYFFAADGLDVALPQAALAALPASAAVAMRRLVHHGVRRTPTAVLPVGIITSRDTTDMTWCSNPGPDEPIHGLIAVGYTFPEVRDAVDQGAGVPVKGAPTEMPLQLRPCRPTALRQVLICGFRPSTVPLIEAITSTEDDVHVRVLVRTPEAAAEARQRLAEHIERVRLGVHPEISEVRYTLDDGSGDRITFELGDPADPTTFRRLGPLDRVDLCCFVSEGEQGSDPRTTTALLQFLHLAPAHTRVVAEVHDPELALRLNARCAGRGHVFSLEELRSLMMFRSLTVPGFPQVFGRLLRGRPDGFRRLKPVDPPSGRLSFADLACALLEQGTPLVAVEVDGRDIPIVAPAAGQLGGEFDIRALRAAWVIDHHH